jgi:hypothetical protein
VGMAFHRIHFLANETPSSKSLNHFVSITHFVTSDRRSMRIFSFLENGANPQFDIVDIQRPYNETYGLLDF